MHTFTLRPSVRAALGALLFASLALRSTLQLPIPDRGTLDAVSPILRDFTMTSAFLPPVGRVGYIGQDGMRYFLAQKALVPRVLATGTQFEFVIIDVPPEKRDPALTAGLVLQADVAGIGIYQRQTR